MTGGGLRFLLFLFRKDFFSQLHEVFGTLISEHLFESVERVGSPVATRISEAGFAENLLRFWQGLFPDEVYDGHKWGWGGNRERGVFEFLNTLVNNHSGKRKTVNIVTEARVIYTLFGNSSLILR